MSNGRYIKPQGELRQSQVVMTFGPGSMVDLPKHSVLIADWTIGAVAGPRSSKPVWQRRRRGSWNCLPCAW
jgi:hypothetical protein